MKILRIVPILALVFVISACSEDPIEPPSDSVMGPQLAANGAEVSRIDWTYNSDAVWPYPCANGGAGDDIHWLGQFYWEFQYVYTPSGNVQRVARLVGEDVTYTSVRNGDTYVRRGETKGGAQNRHYLIGGVEGIWSLNDMATLVNERTGEVLYYREIYHGMLFPDEFRFHDHYVETCK